MKTVTSFALFLLIQVVSLNANRFQVQIEEGVLKGAERKSRGGKSFGAYRGIPYAEPPVGDKRFQAPLPVKPWKGVLDATKFCENCPQRDVFTNNFTIYGNENCLCLNVYASQISEHLLPVIVFIHGGGFIAGSGDDNLYGPDILLDRDLVVVTINYRLGALGFLSFEDGVLPGNNGLKDQTLALKWMHRNIEKFGGNPNKITIYGNSAGSASVYYHLLSPLSKGLFNGAISSSGIATAPWALAKEGEAKRNALRLAEYLNCPLSSSETILQCLKKISAYDIVRESDKFMEILYHPIAPHKPVVEAKLPGAFLPKHPFDIITSGEMAQVPYINGVTANDGAIVTAAIFNNSHLVQRLNKEFDYLAPIILNYYQHPSNKDISKKVKEFYLENKDFDSTSKTKFTNAITDALLYCPQRVTSLLHSKYSKHPVYFYVFGFKGSVTMQKTFGDKEHDYGVCHGDDLLYSLTNGLYTNPTAMDQEMTKIMSTIWYNFANTGNPTPDVGNIITTKWEPVTENDFKYLSIKNISDITMCAKWADERCEFWEKLHFNPNFGKIREEL